MKRQKSVRQTLCLLISILLLQGGLSLSVQGRSNGQGKPVIISFGQPNIWSLEQAHYLLARLRAQGMGLQSKAFGAEDLDPNAVNGTRLQLLKTLLGVGVGFNQAAGFQNEQATKEAAFNQDRRHQLLALRDQRQADLHAVNDHLSTLNVELEKMKTDGSSDAQKQLKQVEIDQETARKNNINNEITGINTELGSTTAPSTALATPSPPAPVASPLPNSVFDNLMSTDGFKKELGNLPNLDASTKLDNYLNLQYEIIAKQLTLLRDEVGPDQRLVFLELPQSFYTVPDKANRKMAQVWWHVDHYYVRSEDDKKKTAIPAYVDCSDDQQGNEIKSNPNAWAKRLQCNPYGVQRPRHEEEIFGGGDEQKNAEREVRTVDLIPRQSALNVNDIQDTQKTFNLMGLFTWLSGIGVSFDFQRERRLFEQFIQQDVYASAFGKGKSEFGWTFGPRPGTQRIAPGLQNTFAVLAVPNDAEGIELTARGCFFPRTSFAPEDFNDTENNLQCPAEQQTFKLVIPSTTENNFWVTGINYRPVRVGERVTAYIHGEYFSPQVGVLVNGAALRHSIGLAQSELSLPRTDGSFEPAPVGDLEFVNSKLLVLSFSLPNFKGTPSIALVTPGRAREINDLRVIINNSYKCSPDDLNKRHLASCPPASGLFDDQGKPITNVPVTYKKIVEDEKVSQLHPENSIWVRLDSQPAMFSEFSPAPVLSVDSLKVFEPAPDANTFRAQLLGSKFTNDDKVLMNDTPVSNQSLVAPGLFEFEFPATNATNLDVTVIHNAKNPDDSIFSSKSFPNPLAMRVDKVTVLSFDADHKPPLLTVELAGSGFSSHVEASVRPEGDKKTASVVRQSNSPTSMVLSLELSPSDSDFIVIELKDIQTGVRFPVVVSRPPMPKSEQPQQGGGDNSNKPASNPPKRARRPR